MQKLIWLTVYVGIFTATFIYIINASNGNELFKARFEVNPGQLNDIWSQTHNIKLLHFRLIFLSLYIVVLACINVYNGSVYLYTMFSISSVFCIYLDFMNNVRSNH